MRPRVLGVFRLGLGVFRLGLGLCLASSFVVACGGDPVVPVDATPDADTTDALDQMPPDTMITVRPPALINSPLARFEFTSDETATFKCKLDVGTLMPCTSPVTYQALTDGSHTFDVTAFDTSDNPDLSPATYTWRIDTVQPETEIIDAPAAIDNSTQATFTFISQGEPGATFECSVDTAVFAVCTSPLTTAALSDGTHTFRVRAKDLAGNFDSVPASHNWAIDSVSPDTVIDSGPAGIVAARSATFGFSSPGQVAGYTFACHLDAAAFSPCVSPRTLSGLADGVHVFEVRVTDDHGNTDPTPARRTWTIDATGPVTSITVRPDNPSGDVTPTFEFTANEPATFECQIDGQIAYAPCTTPFTAAPLPGGNRFFRIRGTDMIGNRGAEATYEWVIDAAGPTVTITSGPNGPVASTTAVFNWNSTEPATFCYRFTGDVADTCTMALAGSGTVNRPGLAQGMQTFTVTATDGLGNAGPPTVRNFVVDTVGPAVMITAGPMNTVGGIANLFTFASPEASTYCYKVDAGGEVCTTAPALMQAVTINAPDGSHTLEVVARDPLGNRTAVAATRTWTVDTIRPATTIVTGPAQGTTLDTGDATVELGSSEASTICWKVNGGAETCSAAGEVAFTAMVAGMADGTITFVARSQDAIGFGPTVTRTWIVDTVRPTVSITAGPGAGAATGSSEATFTVMASEPSAICWQFNGAAVTCSASGLITFSPAKAGLPEGANTFTVFARDAIGDGPSVMRMWTIDTIRPTVSITAGPLAGTTQGSNLATFTVGASEASTICWRFNGGVETCAAAGLMQADAMSPALPEGGNVFEAYARDGIGTGVAITRSWRIDTTRPTITITAGPAQGSTLGTAAASFTLISSERATICWQFNGGAQVCTQPNQSSVVATATGLAEGAATFSATGADAVGTGVATTRNWTVDTVRPTITITAGPNPGQRINAVNPTISVTSSEAATICSRLDGAPEQCTAAGQMSNDIMLAALAQGDHSLVIYARDLVGVGPTTTRSFIVDTVRPTVTVTTGPAAGATINSTTANFGVTASEGSTICWKFDNGAETCSAAGATVAAPSINGLGQGMHTIEVKAADFIGNGASVIQTWFVDTIRPTVTIIVGPAQGSTTANNNSSFTVTTSEAATICWRFNGGVPACSAAGQVMASFISGVLPAGLATLQVEAYDGFGAGPSLIRSWRIDTARPLVTIASGPLEGEEVDRNNPTFGITSSEPSTICWQFNGGPQVCSAAGQVSANASTVNLPDGPNVFTVKASDEVGFGLTVTRNWVVDTQAPVFTISAPPAEGASTTQINTTFTINTNEPATICWKLDNMGAFTCSNPPRTMTFNAVLNNLSAGNHTLDVTATDKAANVRAGARHWTVDLTAPVVTISSPPAQNATTNATSASFTIGSNELSTICWALDGGASTCSAANVVSFVANVMNLGPGPHALVATVTDVAGNSTAPTRNWTVFAGLNGVAALSIDNNAANSFHGSAVASAGDVNNDGFADVIVGAPGFSNGQANEGKAFLYLGGVGGLNMNPAWTFESDVVGARFGAAVAPAGDINGDGFADVLVGAPNLANGQADEGRAYLFLGSNAGSPLSVAAAWTFESNQVGALLGSSLSGAGDVNADTKRDVVLGAPGFANGQVGEGAVYLFLGTGAATLPAAAASILESNLAGANLAASVAGAGDINADGMGDVVAGAIHYSNGQAEEGAVYVFLGAAAGLAAPVIVESNVVNARLGNSVATAGDINGDLKADVVAGASEYANGQALEGAAYVWLGTAAGLAAVPTILEQNVANARFGSSVASAGDTDGDGKADVLVGTPVGVGPVGIEGSAYLFLGGAVGIGTNVAWRANGGQVNGQFGFAVAGVGDINGDGKKDAVIGAPNYDSPEVDEGIIRIYMGTAAMAKPGQPVAPRTTRLPTPAGAVATGATVSAWVRDTGLAGGDVLALGTAGNGCTLHGAQAIVVLECQAGGAALPLAFGVMGSMARSDRAWHLVTISISGDRAALWIDGIQNDTAQSAGASILGQGALDVRPVTAGGYALDRLISTR